MATRPCRKLPGGVTKVPSSVNRDARSTAFFSIKALAKVSPRARTAASSRAWPALAELFAPMTSVHARNAKPRRCIMPRSTDLHFWGAESARYVLDILISFFSIFILSSLVVSRLNPELVTLSPQSHRVSPLLLGCNELSTFRFPHSVTRVRAPPGRGDRKDGWCGSAGWRSDCAKHLSRNLLPIRPCAAGASRTTTFSQTPSTIHRLRFSMPGEFVRATEWRLGTYRD